MNQDSSLLPRLWGTSPGVEYIPDPFPLLARVDLNDWIDWQTMSDRLDQKQLYKELFDLIKGLGSRYQSRIGKPPHDCLLRQRQR
jgi:hypothetical protein